MSIETKDTEVAEAIKEQNDAVRQSAAAARVTNALILAQMLGLDMTEPLQAQRVLRHLRLVERYTASDSDD